MIMAQGMTSFDDPHQLRSVSLRKRRGAGSEGSIVRIAGAGFRLSLLLNAAACQLAQSKIEIHSIAKGISLFALTLKHVGQTLETTGLERSPEATEKAREIAGQGQVVFVEIEHMLDKLQGTDADEGLRRIPIQERLRWCFRPKHVTYLLAQLESLKLSLIVMLRILQLGDLMKSTGTDAESSDPMLVTEDVIAQEKAEVQNMIIVRYWAVKRLDRLWDSVEQEALDAAQDPTNQKISSAHSSTTASALKPLVTATKGSDITRLHAVTFGDSDVGLSDIERSPKDMVHLSEKAMNRLISIWVPSTDVSKLRNAGKITQPRAYVSSDSDGDTEELDFDSHDTRGYYLEGRTVDWRQPQSQEARRRAAELRRQYSSYQAHVESEPEPDEALKHRESHSTSARTTDSSDEGEQRSNTLHPPKSVRINDSPVQSRSFSSKPLSTPNADSRSTAPPYPSGSFPPPTQNGYHHPTPPYNQPPPTHIPGPPPHQQSYKYYPTQEHSKTAPRSIPTNQNPPNPPAPASNPSPRGTPPTQFEPSWGRHQGYSNNMLQPRHHASAYQLSSSSPESSYRPPPPTRSAQRSPSHSHRRSTREEARERNKSLQRNATRGLVGIGAIAGFMDALEAFSIL